MQSIKKYIFIFYAGLYINETNATDHGSNVQ